TTPNGHTIDSDRNHRYPSSSNIYHSAKGGGRIQGLAPGTVRGYFTYTSTPSSLCDKTATWHVANPFCCTLTQVTSKYQQETKRPPKAGSKRLPTHPSKIFPPPCMTERATA
ncbi:hypothetical protein, partial [Candidatus Igneacidithiobacillus taiwanensis]|uniref:hypothetical protein n=1 Tax=Candidatus Igneacidithiobacillus taiwanensis TaxID=1945924 RepID=UPI00289F3682